MQRLFIVYNPNSSRYQSVRTEVLAELKSLKGYLIGKYAIKRIGFENNVANIAKLLKNDDIVVVAGGDGTASIVTNAIIKSKKSVRLAALPYGNFNDLARTLNLKTLKDALASTKTTDFYPLEIKVDGKHWRWAPCYVTIGMVAESCELFDNKDIREELQKDRSNKWKPYVNMAKWFFKNHRKKTFIPKFSLNGVPQNPKISDYAAVNSRYMARVMQGREDYKDPQRFRSTVDNLANLWKLTKLMTRSIVDRTPGVDTTSDVLQFDAPGNTEIQSEGEYKMFENIKKIEIKKGAVCLKMIHNN